MWDVVALLRILISFTNKHCRGPGSVFRPSDYEKSVLTSRPERCDYSRKSATGIYRNSIMVKSSSPCCSGVQSQPGFDQDLNFTVLMPIYCNELTPFFTLQNFVLSFLACRLQQRVGWGDFFWWFWDLGIEPVLLYWKFKLYTRKVTFCRTKEAAAGMGLNNGWIWPNGLDLPDLSFPNWTSLPILISLI